MLPVLCTMPLCLLPLCLLPLCLLPLVGQASAGHPSASSDVFLLSEEPRNFPLDINRNLQYSNHRLQ